MHFPCNIILKQWKKIKKNDKIKMISVSRKKIQHLSSRLPKQNELLPGGLAQQLHAKLCKKHCNFAEKLFLQKATAKALKKNIK